MAIELSKKKQRKKKMRSISLYKILYGIRCVGKLNTQVVYTI